MVNMMNSKKHYTFISLFFVNIIVVYEIELLINGTGNGYFGLLIPVVSIFLKLIYRYFLIKDLLITSIVDASQIALLGFTLIKC